MQMGSKCTCMQSTRTAPGKPWRPAGPRTCRCRPAAMACPDRSRRSARRGCKAEPAAKSQVARVAGCEALHAQPPSVRTARGPKSHAAPRTGGAKQLTVSRRKATAWNSAVSAAARLAPGSDAHAPPSVASAGSKRTRGQPSSASICVRLPSSCGGRGGAGGERGWADSSVCESERRCGGKAPAHSQLPASRKRTAPMPAAAPGASAPQEGAAAARATAAGRVPAGRCWRPEGAAARAAEREGCAGG